MSGFSAINYALSKKLDNSILTGVVSHSVDNVNKSITFTFNDGTSSTIQFNNPFGVDVPKTEFTLDASCDGVYKNGDTSLNNCWYAIRNGWCILQIDLRCLQEGSGYKRIFTSTPKPIATIANVIMTNDKLINEGDKPLIIVIGTDGVVKAEGGKIGGRYIGSFSYPVAE